MEEEKNYCPHCNGEIMPGARKCKHCGEFLDESLKEDRAPRVPRRANDPPTDANSPTLGGSGPGRAPW